MANQKPYSNHPMT